MDNRNRNRNGNPPRIQHYFGQPPVSQNRHSPQQPFPPNGQVPQQQQPPFPPNGQPNGAAIEEQPEKKSNAAMIVAVVAAVTVVLAAAGILIYLFFFSGGNGKPVPAAKPAAPVTQTVTESSTAAAQPSTAKKEVKTVTMPDIEGLSETEAYLALNAADVRYKVRREYSSDVEINHVILQTPSAGENFPRTEDATVVISKGRENEIHTSPTKPPTTKPQDSKPDSEATTGASKPSRSGDYLLPGSDSTYLDESDLAPLNREELNLALNEIFARHGRKFSDTSIRAYFESKDWYRGTVSPADFDMNVLNQYELYNLNLISSYQEDLGYR